MRVLPPIPPVGMTMGPVGKERDEEAGTELEDPGMDMEGIEIESEPEGSTVGREMLGIEMDRALVGALDALDEAETAREEEAAEEADPVGLEETRTVCMRLPVGKAGVSSSDLFFFSKELAFLTDRPV